jgi:ribonuclease HI
MVYTLRFDGCANPNPGEMGIGVVVWNDNDEKIMEISEKAGQGTNNKAEYHALIRGMEELSKIYSGILMVLGDSQLVIHQLNGQWRVKKEDLVPLYERVLELEKKFEKVSFQWVDRDENKDADALSAKAVGLDGTRRQEAKIHLDVGSEYIFVFDDDSKIKIVKDERFDRDVTRYYVKQGWREGRKTNGTYLETGSKKLNEKLDYFKPLKDKKFRIMPRRARNWVEYIVEEIQEEK